MFAINEIEAENKNSIFPRMFYFLAQSVSATCGRSGEGAVREAVRRFATERGSSMKKEHQKANRKQNVKSYYCASDSPRDTRKRETLLCLDEEVCLKEVYTCPYADIWKRYEASDIGNWFCEEYEKAKFEAYTSGYGQAHLSSRLTNDMENHCRFSMYYRQANVSPEEAMECFTDEPHKEAISEDYDEQFYISSTKQCVMFYYAMYEVAGERLGHEGVCAVANGLKALAKDVFATMRIQARHTRCRCDNEFAEKNFALPLLITDEIYTAGQENEDANFILQKHLLDPVGKALGGKECIQQKK